MEPLALFKCLSDDTRLATLLLIRDQQELCVCEITAALAASQPKVSRHLAQLRECRLLSTRREGQWVYYRINEELPGWVGTILGETAKGNPAVTADCRRRLNQMGDRPQRSESLCGASA